MLGKDARQRAYDKGVWSEELAVRHLEKQKFKILQQRYKTKFGEIDIVALKRDMLVFAEVKARPDYADGAEAVNYRARRRIEQAALHFIAMHEEAYADYAMRFDVIVVYGDKKGGLSLTHLDNAWEAGS